MKNFVPIAGTILTFIFVVIACVGSYYSHDYSIHTMPTESIEVIVYDEPVKEVYVPQDVPLIRTGEFVNLTFEEMDLLESIAMAEARGEGSVGMAYVMRVVLNRSEKTGKSIREVIFAPNQFYTQGMGIEPSEECHEALAMIIDGWDESQGAIYFCSKGYSKYGEPLFQYGGHYFSK